MRKHSMFHWSHTHTCGPAWVSQQSKTVHVFWVHSVAWTMRARNKVKQHSVTPLSDRYPHPYPHPDPVSPEPVEPQRTDLQNGRGCSRSTGLLAHSEEAALLRFSAVTIRVSWRSINPYSSTQTPPPLQMWIQHGNSLTKSRNQPRSTHQSSSWC